MSIPSSASTTANYGSTGTMTIKFQVLAGSDPVELTNLTISGTNASSFSLATAGCGDVLAGEECDVPVVYYAPAAGGTPLTASAKLNFTVNDVKSGETLRNVYPAVSLSGSVNDGQLSVGSVDSTVISNRDVTMTFTVTSNGQKKEAKIVQVGGKAISGLGNNSCIGLNYKGGSFPGTGGTCTLNSNISSCTIVLSVPATTNTCNLSNVELNYDGGSGNTTANIGGSVTRKNILMIGDNSGSLSYINIGDFGAGDFTAFTPAGITGQITALAAGKDADGGEVFAVASSGKVLIDRYNTTQAFSANSWTDTSFPTTGVQQLAIQKGVATNNQYLFARTGTGIYFYDYAASSPRWSSNLAPSTATSLTGMAVATGNGSQTVIMLLGTVGSTPTVWYQTLAFSGARPSSNWAVITPSGTSLVLNNLSESGGFFQLSGSVSGTATIFMAASTLTSTFTSGSWTSHAVDAQTAGAVASYYNFLDDGNGTSVVANYSGSNITKTYYGTSANPSTGTISYTDVTPSGLATNDKFATFVGAYLTGTTTGSAERRIIALKTGSTDEFYWSWFGENPVSWTLAQQASPGETTLPNAVTVTNTGLFP